jgi:hypothetical protein
MYKVKYKYFLSFWALMLSLLPLQAERWGVSSNPRETLFLHTDRDLYVAGENLFFDLSLFSEPNSRAGSSGFAYIALRNNQGTIKRITVALDRQSANGELYLPDTLSSGYYELVAFTNWMRNAGEEWYFRKPIFVANRFDTTLEALYPPAEASPKVRFFPEGGHLVGGVDNRVMMLAEGPFDASNRKLTILTGAGDTIAHSHLNQHGWGTFNLTPQDTIQYLAALEGAETTFPLPNPSAYGIALKADLQDNSLRISLAAQPGSTLSGKLQIAQNAQVVKDILLNINSHEPFSVSIPMAELPKGLFLISIIEQQGAELARRFWFNNHSDNGLIFSISDRFSKREKITLDIENTRRTRLSKLNVTLARKEAIHDNALSLQGWQTASALARALHMEPMEACRIFGTLSPEAINQRLTGISKTGSFDYNDAPGRNAFFMETNQLIVSGKVTRSLDGQALEGVRIILNTPDTLVNLRYTRTNHQGEFQFLLDGYYNDRELVFTPDPATYTGLIEIELFDKFSFETPFEKSWFSGLSAKKEYLVQAQEVVRVNKAFGITHLGPSLIPRQYVFNAPLLFANPLISIRLDDYAPLDDLRDISRELILAWRIRHSGNHYRHSMVSANDRKQMEGSPVLFIDGVITFQLDPLVELNSSTLREIQVHNLEWMHGEMSFPGIVALFSRNFPWKDLDLKPHPTVAFHEAPRAPGRFLPPGHENSNDNLQLPDLRNLAYWDPNLMVSGNNNTRIEFFTGDLSGEYLLKVQGIDAEGQAILFQKVITIKP